MSATLCKKEFYVQKFDFQHAGKAASDVRKLLMDYGYEQQLVRRVAIAAYEAEMNMVIHGQGGTLALEIDFEYIQLVAEDNGPGIPNLQLAMQEGYSTAGDEIREIGFGAGMGLPNINRCVDFLGIQNKPQGGTIVTMQVSLGAEK
jgi:anti-sigma regulatory factor (Ser/Thr protein kinase)